MKFPFLSTQVPAVAAVLTALLLPMDSLAATDSLATDNSAARLEKTDRYSISLYGMYGWNGTWQHHGGFDLTSHMPINRHFEMDAALEYHSPSVCALSLAARPLFPLKVGELFLEGDIFGRFLSKDDICQFTAAASFGYRMDYVSAQIGFSSITFFDMQSKWNSGNAALTESFNFLYRLAFKVRPSLCRWNVGFGVSNFNEFEFERMWAPIFFVGGHYDINRNLTVRLRTDVKPSGIFHMDAQFWGIYVRAGLSWRF